MCEGVSMSKRDIKAKRWEKKRYVIFKSRSVGPTTMEGMYPEVLQFWEQRRVMGDGRIQYREAVQLRSFDRKLSLKRLRRAMNLSEWRDC